MPRITDDMMVLDPGTPSTPAKYGTDIWSLSVGMNCVLYNQEPFALVQNMRSYFKCNPPDCRIISQDNSELMIHKELLYQTNFLCEMVRSVDIENSNIDILCPDLTKQEIQILIRFLYTGEISCQDQIVAAEVSSNLTKLFGFPTIYQCSTTYIQDTGSVMANWFFWISSEW